MLNDFYHMLDPVAISAGPITIYWYGLAYVVGALLTAVVMYRTQRRWGFNITIDDLTSVVVGVVFGLIIGARLFYVVFYGDGYYWAHPLEIFATNEGGMSFHGGLVGGIIGGVLVCRMYKLDAWTIADLAVIGAPLALCLGRCANFVNGELWGKPTDLPWGVVFGGTAGDMPRHPSQLYEAFLEGIVLFCILSAGRRHHHGSAAEPAARNRGPGAHHLCSSPQPTPARLPGRLATKTTTKGTGAFVVVRWATMTEP